jgi:hypothetical protein
VSVGVEQQVPAAAVEAAEAHAWADLVAGCPSDHAESIGLHAAWVGATFVMSCPGGGFDRGHFNRPIGLGVVEPTTQETVEELVAGFRAAGVSRFMLVEQPECRPAEYLRWLRGAGLHPNGAWDRVVRGAQPLTGTRRSSERRIVVEEVDRVSVEEWASFIAEVYRLEAKPWLRALHGRPGWSHYLAREDGRLVAARSMFVPDDGGLAFLGIDGPVPGVMTQDYEPDAELCRAIVAAGLERGAGGFLADIEAPLPAQDTPAYGYFRRLGFRIPYTRTHYMAV